ncbi:MAG: adenine phosphoribosyltransferase [Sphingobacteriales bacterium]|nr:adenine phosphoribosyltransferase [Sphingobacteriales bacterium]
MNLKEFIRDVPDFPKPGILFHDVTTLFKNPLAFNHAIESLFEIFQSENIDYVAGIEARGFIVGSILAYKLKCGFIPVRKPGKLPYTTISEKYSLEYGTDKVEMHLDAIEAGKKALVVDDLVATGGTIMAAIRLVEKLGASVAGVAAIIDMPDLGGRKMLEKYNYHYLIEYSGH